MEKTVGVRVGFGDEYSFNVFEHVGFLERNKMGISARWVGWDNQTQLSELEGLTRDEFNGRLDELKKSRALQHVTELSDDNLKRYRDLLEGPAWDIGSGVGKDHQNDPKYKEGMMKKTRNTIRAAHALGTKRVRMFSTYGNDTAESWARAVSDIREVLKMFQGEGLVGYIENETELLVETGDQAIKFIQDLDMPNVLLYHDAANLVRADTEKTGLAYKSYLVMEPALGGFHLKDARYHKLKPGESRKDAPFPHYFIGEGDAGYERIFAHFASRMEAAGDRLEAAGLPREVGFVWEPHIKFQSNVGGITQYDFQEAVDKGTAIIRKFHIPLRKVA